MKHGLKKLFFAGITLEKELEIDGFPSIDTFQENIVTVAMT